MLTYFSAKKAERVLTEYKRLTLAYWRARPPDQRDWMSVMDGVAAPENVESIRLREQIMRMFIEADNYSRRLGIDVVAYSCPPPAVGGPVLPVNLLHAVIDQHEGHSTVPRAKILDTLDKCIGAAIKDKKRLLWRQTLNPLWYIIEAVAFVIRIPFLILQRAGLPEKVEESVWGHIVKVLEVIAILGIATYYGIKVTAGEVIEKWLHK